MPAILISGDIRDSFGLRLILMDKPFEQCSRALMFQKMLVCDGYERYDRDGKEYSRYSGDLFTGKYRQNDHNRMQVNAAANDARVCDIVVNDPQDDKKDRNVDSSARHIAQACRRGRDHPEHKRPQ